MKHGTSILLLAGALLAVSMTHAATLSWSTTAPTVDGSDIANFAGVTADASNISGGDDAQTYVAGDRDQQGQSFTTGSSPYGYTVRAITVQHVQYTSDTSNYDLGPGWGSWNWFTLRVGTVSAGTFAGITSENAVMTDYFPNGLISGTGGSGAYATITLDVPVTLAANTTYGFTLESTGPYFEINGDGTTDANYGGGTAFNVPRSTNPGAATTYAGDHVFHVDMVPNVAPDYLTLSNEAYSTVLLTNTVVTMDGHSELHLTGSSAPLIGCTINMTSVNSWVFIHQIAPSVVISSYLNQFQVDGAVAVNGSTVKVVQYGQGAVVIPYSSNFQPMEVFDGENFSGDSINLSPNTSYGAVLSGKASSFTLKRGYEATLAQNADGTGQSVNYVAADGDLEIGALPAGLNNQVNFIRIYPWHWVTKKGSCDIAAAELNAKWYYNWNVTWQEANPDYEYVAIKQQRWWPGLPNPGDAGYLGVNHVNGYNEPNNPVEDAYTSLNNGDVATAVGAWGDLEWTGMRIGAPAVTDGGRSWILDFMSQAEAAGRRVDYIPIHYYRSYWNNNDPASAANNLYAYLKDIYDQTHKPIWLTEFNNGANWTTDADPTFDQNKNVIEAMINMMDDAPWVERYSVYSAVEEVRQVYYNAGGYTPMGAMYRDHISPMSYQQILPGAGRDSSAAYDFENNLEDSSGSGNHAVSHNYPDFVAGHNGGTALQFDGVNDHVILPDSLSDSTDFTFAAWIYWDGGSAWQRIFDFGIMDSGTYMFLTPSEGTNMRFAITTGGWSQEQPIIGPALTPNQWTHVAVTLSGNTGTLYVNGTAVGNNASMTLNPADLGAIQHYLGRSQFPVDPYFSGKMDDVIIKNQALSQTQIQALMGTQPPTVSTNVVDGGILTQGEAYSGTVAGTASDPDGGAITYSKVYGPSWLSIGSDGSLTGTPGYDVNSDQLFTIRATDATGAMNYFVLDIGAPAIDYGSGPIAYWDFNDPSLGAANGVAVPDSDAYTIWREAAHDRTENGNDLTTWDYDWAGFTWSTNSQQGDFSIKSAGTYPAAYTWSSQSLPSGIDVESFSGKAFTVEAIATVSGSATWRTLVGRDAQNLSTGDAARAALYLGLNDANHARFQYTDVNGNTVDLYSITTYAADDNVFHHFAGVSDGSTVSLYVDGELVAQATSQSLEGLGIGATSGGDWHAGGWSIGRGLYNGGHTDRWYGYIDAVAISGVALAPGSFVTETFGKSGYELYATAYGIPGALFADDWNSNGIPNGMEYYLGFNPTNPATAPSILTWTNNYLTVVHPYNSSASGVTGMVEWTTDLLSGSWNTSGVSYATNSAAGEIEATLGSSTTNQLFLRLKVEQ